MRMEDVILPAHSHGFPSSRLLFFHDCGCYRAPLKPSPVEIVPTTQIQWGFLTDAAESFLFPVI